MNSLPMNLVVHQVFIRRNILYNYCSSINYCTISNTNSLKNYGPWTLPTMMSYFLSFEICSKLRIINIMACCYHFYMTGYIGIMIKRYSVHWVLFGKTNQMQHYPIVLIPKVKWLQHVCKERSLCLLEPNKILATFLKWRLGILFQIILTNMNNCIINILHESWHSIT